MRDLGYYPSTSRSDEPGAQVSRISVVLTELDDAMYTPSMVQGLLETAADQGVQTIVRLLEPLEDATTAQLNAWARSLLGGGSQGAVFVACDLMNQAQLEACERVGLPIVAVDCHTMMDAGVTAITSNNFAGGHSLARHLLDLGHRRIGLVTGLQTSATARERSSGFLTGIAQAGIRQPAELLFEGDFVAEAGAAAARQFLSLTDPPTAIAASCDSCAMGVIDSARARGLDLPGDLSITGFDNTKVAIWSSPKLTTVNQPLKGIAELAVTTVLAMIHGKSPISHHIQLGTELVVRDSTAPPRVSSAFPCDTSQGPHGRLTGG
jgi:LacI family transcriptional regulator